MLQKTRGIALRVTNYSENSVVVQVYTELYGLQSYLINGAKKPKAKIHVNLFQPLHLLDMVVYYKDNNSLQRIKEAQQYPPLLQLPLDIIKSTIALFLNEVLYKVLKHQSADAQLFEFIHQSILWLDNSPQQQANFHLVFLIKLSKFLGFMPLAHLQPQPYFNLMEGTFMAMLPAHSYILQEPHTSFFHQLLSCSYEDAQGLKIPAADRSYLLEKMVEFYRLHTENFGQVHALSVLKEIFH